MKDVNAGRHVAEGHEKGQEAAAMRDCHPAYARVRYGVLLEI
jgi:hypothetical protein